MAKLLNTTFLVTQSAPATPSSGLGTLYASSSMVFYKNNSGTTYNLTLIGSSSFIAYTSAGTYTYTTGSRIQYIKVVCIGGGGGGGGGANSGVTTPGYRNGGAGAAGGNINIAYFSSQSLAQGTYTVTVGGGGNGGTAGVGGAGVIGGNGSASSFSSASINLVRGPGGNGGNGGSGGAVVGQHVGGMNFFPGVGSTGTNVPIPYPPFYLAGCHGGSSGGGVATGPRGLALGGARWLAAGGAAGGTSTISGIVSASGGSGSAIYSYATLTPSGSPGAPGINGDNGAGVVDIAHLWFASGSGISTGIRIGTGGHGGGSATIASQAGRGGSGSLGAGGGGGGGGLGPSGGTANNGGPGGSGCVLIFEYY